MSEKYRGHEIKPKLDFGEYGYWIDGKYVKKGWVVVKDYCNIMPGATWFQTVPEAKEAIDLLIAVKGNAKEFWRRIDDDREAGPAYYVTTNEKTAEVSIKLKGQKIAVMKQKGDAGKEQAEKIVKALLQTSAWPVRGYVEESYALNVIEGSKEEF